MCLIVHKFDDKAEFTSQQFESMVNTNKDGLGIMYREEGRIKVEKCLGTAKEMKNLWEKHNKRNHYVMHARFKTHGAIDLDNCHPYEVLNMDKGDPIDLYMVHNGVINGIKDVNPKMSDTWNFVEGIIKPMAKADIKLLWNNEYIQYAIDRMIGSSKLVFMRSDDDCEYFTLTVNEKAGDRVNGCWLSNLHSTGNYRTTSYDPVTRKETTSYHQRQLPVVKKEGKKKEDLLYNNWWDKWRSPLPETDETPEDEKTTKDKDEEAEQKLIEEIAQHNKILNKTCPIGKKPLLPAGINIKDAIIEGGKVLLMPVDDREKYSLLLQQYKQLKDPDIIDMLRENPREGANIIWLFMEKNNIPFNILVSMCTDIKRSKECVNLIRHCNEKNVA